MDKFGYFLLGIPLGFGIGIWLVLAAVNANEQFSASCTEAYYKHIPLQTCQNFTPALVKPHPAQEK